MTDTTVSDARLMEGLDALDKVCEALANNPEYNCPPAFVHTINIVSKRTRERLRAGVKVRPLDWKCIAGHDGHFWRAGNPFGGLPFEADTGEQKARCEADYEQRILSALYAAPQPAPVVTKHLLHGVCDSLHAAISEYEDRGLYPGSRRIMQSQLDALTAALTKQEGSATHSHTGGEE